MKANNVRLTFKCPVKWNSMASVDGGRYCSSCKKTVKDFSGSSLTQICSDGAEKNECGSFDAIQLHKPFGDKRDLLVGYYQRLKNKNPSGKILLMFVTILLFLSGCSRRLSGAYAYWDYKGENAHTNDTVAVKSPEMK
jgi:hypothetical protein